ncbi:putative nuclease HARBI1 [Dreissena polymorpha]|uniref:putative nuclease HARBI1 n=1 Tax=Dreissena polymorpha TaxID=45954 RepID=UPI002263F005|nr:putative nuclease HARBI1 [Dreissena polymorpha]
MDAVRLVVIGALVQQQNQNLLRLQQAVDRRRRERRRRDRVVWVRQWILRRPEHGLYHKLMVELRNEDPRAFHHFMRMPPAMFDEVVQRLTPPPPRLTKQDTNYRPSLEPGLKVAIILRHLASGNTYRNMQYAWRVPHNTISVVAREVVKAIIEEYTDELLFCPTTEQGWRDLADKWYQRWNFPHTVGAIDGKHVACKAPPNSGSEFYNCKGFYSVILFAMVDADFKFTYVDVSGNGSSSDVQIYNESDLPRGLDQNRIHAFPQPDPLPNDN